MPYDEFLKSQIAGDLLPDGGDPIVRADRIAATQFLALSFREMDPIEGMVEVYGQQVLGVSINCAKCHDHKLDAYTQHDYYALAGIFTSSRIAGNKNPTIDGTALPGGERVLAVVEGAGKSIGDTTLLIRGEKNQRGPIIPRRFPTVLADPDQTPLGKVTKGSGRLELAMWTVAKENPLTARVFANRVWQRFFGAGIVRTPNDFGLGGDAPTHPELLDYLAHRFANEYRWSVKKLIRDVALSRVYRQSAVNESAASADADNTLCARVPVRRMSYEQIVDNLNAVGGLLIFDRPAAAKNALQLPRFAGKSLNTVAYRAIYHEDPQLRSLFDGADPDLITEGRDSSVTAPQMLFFMNNPQVIAIAGSVAKRANLTAANTDPKSQIDAVYAILFARRPSEKEQASARRFINVHGFEKLCHVLICASEFSYLE